MLTEWLWAFHHEDPMSQLTAHTMTIGSRANGRGRVEQSWEESVTHQHTCVDWEHIHGELATSKTSFQSRSFIMLGHFSTEEQSRIQEDTGGGRGGSAHFRLIMFMKH